MAAAYVTLAASTGTGLQLVTSAFALQSAKGGLAIMVPSAAAVFGPVGVAFGESATGPFFPFNVTNTSSPLVLVGSGRGGTSAVIVHPPTPFGIFTVSSATTTVCTFTVLPLAR